MAPAYAKLPLLASSFRRYAPSGSTLDLTAKQVSNLIRVAFSGRNRSLKCTYFPAKPRQILLQVLEAFSFESLCGVFISKAFICTSALVNGGGPKHPHCQNKAKFLWLRFAAAVGAGCGQEGNHVTGVIHRCYGVLLAQIGRRHA